MIDAAGARITAGRTSFGRTATRGHRVIGGAFETKTLFVRPSGLSITRAHRLRLRRVLLPQKNTKHDINADTCELRLPSLEDREPKLGGHCISTEGVRRQSALREWAAPFWRNAEPKLIRTASCKIAACQLLSMPSKKLPVPKYALKPISWKCCVCSERL